LGKAQRHDGNDCECVKYLPDFKLWEIRLNGTNFLCRRCNRYVDPAKWKGGILKFQTQSRYAKPNHCPCCGWRMSRHRYSKQKLIDSIDHQVKHPELHNLRARRTLKKKVKIIESNILTPRVG